MEQALPVRSEWLNFNRLRIRGERTVPMGPYKLLLCGKGALLLHLASVHRMSRIRRVLLSVQCMSTAYRRQQ